LYGEKRRKENRADITREEIGKVMRQLRNGKAMKERDSE